MENRLPARSMRASFIKKKESRKRDTYNDKITKTIVESLLTLMLYEWR